MIEATIRPGTALDLDGVMRVMDRAFDPGFGEAWSRAQCLGILGLTDVWLDLAEAGLGRLEPGCVGFALSRRIAEDAELLLLAVDPAARRHGIGRLLVGAVADQARRRGASRLLLEMRDGNDAAFLYERAGFAAIGRRPAYYRGGDGTMRDAVTLARPL